MIDQVTKVKVPKMRKPYQGMNNPPPKRFKADDSKTLFPMIGIENSEQRRLAKIASSISGMAS